ncbi:MAG: formate/nitrite transporter family protein [Lachnospiraceae bacterium]|nr:formate/nitrite transporter family protein [Lachnospiraceae bacterium]
MQMHSPKEIIDINMSGAVNKANLRLEKMMALGILAGMFIALGGVASQTASHAITNVSAAKIAAGAVFPIGLLMIVLVGGELFTGNCLMIMATMDKQIRFRRFMRNLIGVFIANTIGALFIAILVYFSGNLDTSGGALGGYTISVAVEKVSHSTIRGIASGFLCNIFVCMAVLKGAAAKEVAGKIQATWFPIFAFVICGFEHIVANMYFIPIGLLAKNNELYVTQAEAIYGVTAEKLASLTIGSVWNNFIPVTIGNLLGGIFIGVMLYFVNVHVDRMPESKHKL